MAASDVTINVTYTFQQETFPFNKVTEVTRHETLSNGSRFYPVDNTVVTIAVTSSASITTEFSATYLYLGYEEKPLTVNTDGNNCTFTPDPEYDTTLNITVRPAGVQVYYVHYSPGDEFGVSGSMADQTFYVGVPQTLSPCGFTRANADFDGWATTYGGPVVYSDGQEVTDIASAGETITLYATWEEVQTFTVHFEANGGTGTMANQIIRSGVPTPLNANTFTREGYVFKGWNQQPDGSNLLTYADGANFTGMGKGIYTLYAQWAPAYTVRFDANGGTGTMADMACKVGTTYSLTANTFTRSGYIFTGWNTATDGSGNAYTDGQSIRNLSETPGDIVTLYAQWTVLTTLASGSVNMPATGFSAVTIPVGTTSFKVYDDGGASGNYSTNCDGYLLLIAPAACTLQLTGTVNTKRYNKDNYLTVHDGGSTASTVLLDKFRTTLSNSEGDHGEVITNDGIGTVSTTDRRMLLYFRSGSETEAGLDLTVTVVESADPDDHFTDNGDGTYTINTTKGWNQFCDALDDNVTYNRFSGKTVKLGGDIGTAQYPITRMAGSSNHDFCGTFDGQGYTLTVNISSDSRDYTAPFSYVSNVNNSPATIRNLNVAGTVTATKDYAGGIVGCFWGTLTIENCTSSVAISTDNKHAAGFISRAQGSATIRNCLSSVAITGTISGDGTHAGFIGGSSNGVTTTIEGCAFIGSMLGSTTTHCAGFVGYNSGTLTISNSLFAPSSVTVGTTNSATFARGNTPTVNNSYYTETLGTAQGTHAYELSAAPERLCNGTGEGIVKTYRNNGLNYGLGFDNKYYLGIIPLSDSETEGVTYLTTNLQGKEVTVEFKRSFTAGKASTICLPFAMNTISGGKVYRFAGITHDSTDGWVATMSDATPDGNKVTSTEANKPYVFMPAATGEVTFNGVTTTIPAAYDPSMLTTTSGDWTFKGTYSKLIYGTEPFSGYVYGFASTTKTVGDEGEVQAGEFVHAKSGASVPSMRCYLKYKDGQQFTGAGARGMTRVDEDLPQTITVRFIGANGEVTAIGTLNTQTGEIVTDGWYTLNGTKLPGKPSKRGVYINNGRKVVLH